MPTHHRRPTIVVLGLAAGAGCPHASAVQSGPPAGVAGSWLLNFPDQGLTNRSLASVLPGDVKDALARVEVHRLAEQFTDDRENSRHDGEIARCPRLLLLALDCREVWG